MKYIGKRMEYLTHSGYMRVATVEKIEFHQGIGKWLFIGLSPFGHKVRLTKGEICKFI
jgi:hypothetical protein